MAHVRIFSPFFPYPPSEGAFQVILGQIDQYIRNGDRVELVYWKTPVEAVERALRADWTEKFPSGVEVVALETRSTASGFARILRIVTSLFSSYSSPENFYYPHLSADQRMKLPREKADLEIFHASLCLRWLDYSIGPRAGKRVCHYHNIEAELYRQSARVQTHPLKKWILMRTSAQLDRNERKVLQKIDEAWFVSRADLIEFTRATGFEKGFLQSPTFSDSFRASRARQRQLRTRNGPFRIGLIGALNFKPNEDSALFVLDEICPYLEKANVNCEVIIAGRSPSARLLEKAARYSFVQTPGFIQDIESFWASVDLMLVPHVSGSGVRIKLLESLASGVPTLANLEAVAALSDEIAKSDLLTICPLSKFGESVLQFAQVSRFKESR